MDLNGKGPMINNKIKVGFLGYNDTYWMGGINYLKNLLYAIQALENSRIEPIILFERNADPSIVSLYKEYATCIFLEHNTGLTFIYKVITRLTNRNFYLDYYVKKYQIDVISHSRFNHKGVHAKIIGWIPDFQHLYLPDLLSSQELELRNKSFRKAILESDRVILSSFDAQKDCISFEPASTKKIRVLHFVSQIDIQIYDFEGTKSKEILNKYGLSGKFFYLPNQFWKHKNHMVVFKAISLLKSKGLDVKVICTGNIKAQDNSGYIESLQKLIDSLGIRDNIILPGVVDYSDVQILMRASVSVLNPSYFEGWSSSVEECKSLGKNMIISNIAVHKEQNPSMTEYFNPDNELELAERMEEVWNSYSGSPYYILESEARERLNQRTLEFGKNYENIVFELFE
jgi:glycosyltransferase involved in cell wall biosynthesis